MSYARAFKTIHLEPTDRVGHVESLDHPGLIQALVGYDPWSNPVQAYVDAYKSLDIDWIIGIPRRSYRFQSDQSSQIEADGGVYTAWGLSGSYWRQDYLFHDVESVLAFDPVSNPVGESLATERYNQQAMENRRADQELLGDSAVVTGVYYTTLFQFPIMVFGWELFLAAAASEPLRFRRVLEGFAEVSRRNLAAWAAEGLDLVLVHDDIAMERGPVFRPEWYRQYLFPLYEYLLEPVLQQPGLKVAFVSDGYYTPLLDDLVSLGFHGFMINQCMDLGQIARRYGDRLFLTGNVDTAVLTFGSTEDVRRHVQRCIEAGRPCRGHFLKAVGDLPHNIPLDNIRAYFAASREFGARR